MTVELEILPGVKPRFRADVPCAWRGELDRDYLLRQLRWREELRRVLVGPKECEITGIAETPDGRTLFVNIQHPGANTAPNFVTGAFGSHWPEGGASRPRSATIVITRDDGGPIGVD